MSDIKIGISARGADIAAGGLRKVATEMKGTAVAAGGLKAAAVSLQSAMAPLIAVFAAFKTATAGIRVLSDATEAYKKQELAARGATEEQKKWAASFQQVVGVGDEVTLGMMRQAKQFGIADDQLQAVITTATGLAEVMGTDVESALMKVMQAHEGNAEALNRSIPGMKNLATQEARLAKIQEVATEGLNQKRESMNQLTGVQQRAANSWGDLLEVIGEIITPIRTLTAQGFAVAAEVLQDVLAPAAGVARNAMVSIKPALDFVTAAIVGTVTAVEVAWNEFPTIIQLGVATAKLHWETFSQDLIHAFTVQIPQLLTWFGENWQNIFVDAFNASITAFKNFHESIAMGMIALWDWIKGGMEGGLASIASTMGEIASRNLLEGFEATTQELPELLSRAITDEEQRLAAEIAGLGASLGDSFSDAFQRRMDRLKTDMDFDLNLGSLAKTLAGGGGNQQSLQATESRLLTRGQSDDPQKAIAKHAEQTVQELAKSNALSQRQIALLERRQQQLQVEVVS